jgi:chromosome segregation ATPase
MMISETDARISEQEKFAGEKEEEIKAILEREELLKKELSEIINGKKLLEDGIEAGHEEIRRLRVERDEAEKKATELRQKEKADTDLIAALKAETAKLENDNESAILAAEIAALDKTAEGYEEQYALLLARGEELRLENEELLKTYEAEVAALDPMKSELDKQSNALSKNENSYLKAVNELNEEYYAYLDEKAKIEKEFENAENDIADAKKLLETSSLPEWYFLGREDSVSASSFASNVEKINAIAKMKIICKMYTKIKKP